MTDVYRQAKGPIWQPPEILPKVWWTIDYLLSEWTGRRVISAKNSLGGSEWSYSDDSVLWGNWGAAVTWWEEGETSVRSYSPTKEQWDKLMEVWKS